jgi:hypothetical protein
MKHVNRSLALVGLAVFALPALAGAQERGSREWDEEYEEAPPPADDAQQPAPAPPQVAQAPAPQGTPEGQWVQTDQYGLVWMPYADAYTYVPPDGYGEPYMYVYCEPYGWSWLAAPWVWGFGPWPHFGVYGFAHFGWYGHGWWRTPGRWHWAPGRFHGGWGGGRGFPSRSFPGSGGARSAPGFRGGRVFSPGFRSGAPGRGGFSRPGGFSSSGGAPGRSGFASRGGLSGGHASRGGGVRSFAGQGGGGRGSGRH